LVAAEKIAALLARHGVDSALIGAAALAVHLYPRSTEDVDLAVGVAPGRLGEIASELRVTADGMERVEIVNFCNPPGGGFPALVEAALRDAVPYRAGAPLRVVTLPHLIVFKLYAGGPKSRSDVLEVLRRNAGVDLDALRAECRRFRLDRKLESWLRDLKSATDG
jgi:hypothetical protein